MAARQQQRSPHSPFVSQEFFFYRRQSHAKRRDLCNKLIQCSGQVTHLRLDTADPSLSLSLGFLADFLWDGS
jgi:hypothetical protein